MTPITDTTYTRPLQCDSCDWQGDETQIHPDHGEFCPKCGVDGVYEPVGDELGIIRDLPALAAGMAVMAILCGVAYQLGIWSMGSL